MHWSELAFDESGNEFTTVLIFSVWGLAQFLFLIGKVGLINIDDLCNFFVML